MSEDCMTRPSSSSILDFDAALAQWTRESKILTPPATWLGALERLGAALGGSEALVTRFVQAWSRLYSATLLLDHLQDQDELGNTWLAAQPDALRYHLAFSAYASAQHDLAKLASDIPPARGVRLSVLWSSTVLQLAIGQYRDLILPEGALADPQQALDTYEELAAQKTGAAVALALGGCVTVVTDDATQVDAAVSAGLLIGMLLQYYDDLLDQSQQNADPRALTLARAIAAQLAAPVDEGSVCTLWELLYRHYARGLHAILAALPESAQDAIWGLLETMFGAVPTLPDNMNAAPLTSGRPA